MLEGKVAAGNREATRKLPRTFAYEMFARDARGGGKAHARQTNGYARRLYGWRYAVGLAL